MWRKWNASTLVHVHALCNRCYVIFLDFSIWILYATEKILSYQIAVVVIVEEKRMNLNLHSFATDIPATHVCVVRFDRRQV